MKVEVKIGLEIRNRVWEMRRKPEVLSVIGRTELLMEKRKSSDNSRLVEISAALFEHVKI